jgi:enoyl-CoA hydratase
MTVNKDIVFEKAGRCGIVTLNRQKALNALTYDMLAGLVPQYRAWSDDIDIYCIAMRSADPRGFCAGGDLRAIYDWHKQGKVGTTLGHYGVEYRHNWALEKLKKPHVSLIDGVVMGSGVGITFYGTHRVVGENTRFAMPEVGVGYFPDVGASYFLPRMPGETGMYLALTGRAVGQADAFYLGFATHCIKAGKFDSILTELCQAEPVDELLYRHHENPGDSELAKLRPVIDRIFAAGSVEEIVEGLRAERGEMAQWAKATADEIAGNSPVSLKVAFRQVREGAHLELDQALGLEYRIARRFMEGDQLYEGIRAALIDKDRKPKWSPASLQDVTPEMVDRYFAPLEDGELELTDPFGSRLGPFSEPIS